MGISEGCQGFSRVVNQLVAYLKGKCFQIHGRFGGLFSVSIRSLPAAPGSFREAPVGGIHKIVLGASEIKYFVYYVSSRGVTVISERMELSSFTAPTICSASVVLW
jgi:hypothetical protein